jgi:hypothetical protein
MFHLTKTKKVTIIVVIATTLCLLLSSFSPIVHSQIASNFTVPVTVNTSGNAWSGDIVFDLELNNNFAGSKGVGNYLVVMDTNGTVVDMRESSTAYGVAYNIAPDTILFQGEPKVGAPEARQPTLRTFGIWLQTRPKTSPTS